MPARNAMSLATAAAEDAAPSGRRPGSGGWVRRRRRASRSGEPPLARAMPRYGKAIGCVALAELIAVLLELAIGRFVAFPFYAAVVGGAYFGIGPGCVAFVLSAVLAADFWTPDLFDWHLTAADVPSFTAFVLFAFMGLAWGWQRQRTQYRLESTVRQRTAELVRANTALQVEMAERAAAEADLARALRLATVAEMAATIAHEINQPLAAIVANGAACVRSLTQHPPLLDNAREAALCVVEDGHRAGDVIARIRSLFSTDPPRRRLLDINDLIRQALSLSRAAIERQGVAAHLELAPTPPPILGDAVQLRQVMMNLVTNALEAMRSDTGRPARLVIRSEAADGGGVRVAVEDTGSGIDPSEAPRVFESFYTTKPDGIGVGLAISRSIVEAHGGSMWTAPGSAGGAIVGFALPAAAAAAE